MDVEELLDVTSNLGQILLHVFFITGVDDFDNLFHLLTNLLHLSFGVGVEEDFSQEGVILRKNAFGNLHVTLEGGAGRILMLHHGCKGKRGDEGDGK